MNASRHKPYAGIILAAGASVRMGKPKALLEMNNGKVLIQEQIRTLQTAGCDPVRVVTGSDADQVASYCGSVRCIENVEWRRGRVSSVICGVKAVRSSGGCILLPVDAAGIQPMTLKVIIRHAEDDVLSVRPFHRGRRGYCCWVSAALYDRITGLDSRREDEARLDDLLRPLEMRIDVDDPAVLNNLNAPADWKAFCKKHEDME